MTNIRHYVRRQMAHKGIVAQLDVQLIHRGRPRHGRRETCLLEAVEQQGAATQEIARNVSQAARGTQDMSRNIAVVSTAAGQTGAAAGQVLESSGELGLNSEALHREVDQFLREVRAA